MKVEEKESFVLHASSLLGLGRMHMNGQPIDRNFCESWLTIIMAYNLLLYSVMNDESAFNDSSITL